MAFTRTSSNNTASTPAADATKNKVGGYLNINILDRSGSRKRLGGAGIALRENHPLEGAILAFIRENPEKLQDLVGRIELTFGEAHKEGEFVDLGL